MLIEELDLSVRSYHCLKRAKIDTVERLMEIPEKRLLQIKNLGKKSADEIVSELKKVDKEKLNGQEEAKPDILRVLTDIGITLTGILDELRAIGGGNG